MARPSDSPQTAILRQTRQTLAGIGQLYGECAAACAAEIPHLLEEGPEAFAVTLAQYRLLLVVKVSVDLMRADWQWTPAEQQLAAEVVEHVWQRRLSGEPLRRAWEELAEKVDTVTLEPLLRPFARLAPLVRRAADLESLVLRLANLIVKVDGHVDPQEMQQLRYLQDSLERHLERPLALDGDTPSGSSPGTRSTADGRPPAPPPLPPPPIARAEASKRARSAETSPPASAPSPPPTPEDQLHEALARLDGLVGLTEIKREVRELTNFLRIQAFRAQQGLPLTAIGLHMVFRGNPGTGKTTVARILGSILGALGIVSRGHLIETDRSGLVAEYAGQTGPKTQRKIDEALDGILFIDEAYSLIAESGDDPYGQEAVQSLLKRMEDDRRRLVVILAGYSEPMDRLLAANPGLKSRFQREFTFRDYTPGQMLEIFLRFAKADKYRVSAAARLRLLAALDTMVRARDEHFGNGRVVRNLFEAAIRRQANRLVSIAPLTEEALTALAEEDVVGPECPIDAESRCDADRALLVECPQCQARRPMPGKFLSRRVKCPACGHLFRAEWGELA